MVCNSISIKNQWFIINKTRTILTQRKHSTNEALACLLTDANMPMLVENFAKKYVVNLEARMRLQIYFYKYYSFNTIANLF